MRIHRRLPRFLPTLLALLLTDSFGGAADPTPDELLSAYAKTLAGYEQPAAFQAEVQSTYDGPILPVGTVMEESTYQVWRDGDRCKILESRTFRVRHPKTGQVWKQDQTGEKLWLEKGLIWVDDKPEQGERFRLSVRARLEEVTATERLGMVPSGMGPVYGRFHSNGLLPLPDILRQGALSARKQQLNGQPVWMLDGSSKWGAYALWLDPEAGYLLRRFEQHKKASDWIGEGVPLTELQVRSSYYFPPGPALEETVVMDGVRIERIGKTPLLTGFTLRWTTRFDKGQSVTITTRVNIRNVRLNPDFAQEAPFQITIPIPNGTRVRVLDQPDIQFEWRDGKVVKAMDQAASCTNE